MPLLSNIVEGEFRKSSTSLYFKEGSFENPTKEVGFLKGNFVAEMPSKHTTPLGIPAAKKREKKPAKRCGCADNPNETLGIMDDKSARVFEAILTQSGQFGFYQKRVFLSTASLQAITVSVLMYVCVAQPESGQMKGERGCTLTINDTDLARDLRTTTNATNDGTNALLCQQTGSFLQDLTLRMPSWMEELDAEGLSRYTVYSQSAGVLMGATMGGISGDIFGRRRLMFVYFLMTLIFHTLTGLANIWQIYLSVRFFTGFCAGAFLSISYVIPVEIVGHSWRDACVMSNACTLGVVFCSLEGLITNNWRYLAFVSGAVGFPFLGTYYLVPESIRWLLCKQKFQAAEFATKELISCNFRVVPKLIYLLDEARSSIVCHMHEKRYTYLDFCHSRHLFKQTVALIYICLVASTVYFCLVEKTQHVIGNIYVDRCFPYVLDLPLAWTAIIVNKCSGRRWCLFLYAVASGLILFSMIVLHMTGNLQSMPSMVQGMALFGKLGVTASISLIAISALEMYPTVIRCMGAAVALASVTGGAILSYQFKFLEAYHYIVPFIIFGAMMISVGLVGLVLPETMGKPLPNILPCKHRTLPLHDSATLINAWNTT
ncbi:solute carrier family 22 member 15-like [Gigantopelta aegis]|uniref:solute carrier family 22 member 15-like n=1 Tax=Gigantopelta aegis TaxID=1735272 RepID=UPI001B88D274|nr:solute carrier family 22 member 15-like [Gigantopelta aegis]